MQNQEQFKYSEFLIQRKLTKDQALYIYFEEHKSLQKLANEFNLNKNSIWLIKQKKSYKWIHNNKYDTFKPKSYNSVQDYQIEMKNKRLHLIQEILLKFKIKKFKFNTQCNLAKKIAEEILNKHFIKISLTTFRNNSNYKNLIKSYLLEQDKF